MLDLKKLEAIAEGSDTSNAFFSKADIGKETDIRILPPVAEMNGLFYFKEIHYWIKNKKYISRKTFGEPCVIEEEIEAAKQLNDPDIQTMLDDYKIFSRKETHLMPILHLNCEFSKGELVSQRVIGDQVKIFQCDPQTVIKQITKIATSRHYQNGTEDGIFDMKEGYNLTLSKTGEKLETKYMVQPFKNPSEVDSKYNKINVVEFCRKGLKSDSVLRAAIREMLYGEEITTSREETAKPSAKLEPKKEVKISPKSETKNAAKNEPVKEEPKKLTLQQKLDARKKLNGKK
jgi:hypothetical protein